MATGVGVKVGRGEGIGLEAGVGIGVVGRGVGGVVGAGEGIPVGRLGTGVGGVEGPSNRPFTLIDGASRTIWVSERRVRTPPLVVTVAATNVVVFTELAVILVVLEDCSADSCNRRRLGRPHHVRPEARAEGSQLELSGRAPVRN